MDIADGWLTDVRHCPSPHFNDRPPGTAVSLLVIHNISLPPGQFGTGDIERLFCGSLDCRSHPFYRQLQGLRVSAHCLIDRCGEVCQFVSFRKRAWHAGVSAFAGRDNCNDFSIGIELEGTDSLAYTEAQYHRLAELTTVLMRHYPAIVPSRIVGHCHIAPQRKTDPGDAFDWARYYKLLEQ